jgi:very-short-patch-repair endonuclease
MTTQRDLKATTPRLRRTPPREGNKTRHTKNYQSLPFNPALKERAKALRKAGNLSEVLLWNQLKRGQFKGLDFDRQKIIGNYIVDFYCAEKQAVLEVDGSSHDDKAEYDAQRDAFLMGLGLCVIHILDVDVKQNLAGVMDFLSRYPAFVDEVTA